MFSANECRAVTRHIHTNRSTRGSLCQGPGGVPELVCGVRTKTDRIHVYYTQRLAIARENASMAQGEVRAVSIAARVAQSLNNSTTRNWISRRQGFDSRSALPVSIDTKFGRDESLCFPCVWRCLRPVVLLPCSCGCVVSSCLCSCSLWHEC